MAAGLTDFEQVLLGMLCRADATGYDLKRAFSTTPLAVYQPSSGAMYPALRRLEHRGLIDQAARDPKRDKSARTRHVLHATRAGRAEHRRWLRGPVDSGTVSAQLGLHLMRFVMMEHQLSTQEIVAFLRELERALAGFLTDLEDYRASARFTDRHPPLALDHGVAVHRASHKWAQHAIADLTAATSHTTAQPAG